MKKLFRILLTLCMTLALCPATALAEGSDGGVVKLLWQDSGGIYSGTDRSNGVLLTKAGNYCELNAGSYRLNGDISFSDGSEAFKFSGNVEVNLDHKQVSSTGRTSFFVDNGSGGGLLKLTGGGTVSSEKSDDFSYGCFGNITGHQIVIDGITVKGGTIGICNGVNFGSYWGGDSVTMQSGSIEDCNVGIWVPEKLTLGGGTIGTKEKPLPTAILLSGTMNADGGTVYGTVKSCGTITRSPNATGTTAFYGAVENGTDFKEYGFDRVGLGTIFAGEYFGTVNNNVVGDGGGSTISGGTFHGTVNNNSNSDGDKQATISGGDFDSDGVVNNSGLIQNGTFKGTVTNNASGKIEGGTFSGEVTNAGTISGGTFNGKVTNAGAVTGGAFYGGIEASGSGSISGKQSTVSFDLNGGVVAGTAPADQIFVGTSTAKAQEPSAEPTKEGCTFTGWYTDSACTHEYNFDSPVTKDVTLYAGFQPDFYAVSFDPNGGILDAPSSVAYTTAEGTLALGKLPEPTRDGCKFTGWFTEKDGGSKVTLSTIFTQNATLYAHWEEAPAGITDNADGTSGTAIAKTGDDSHVAFWLALLAVSAATATLSFALQTARRRTSRRR